LRKPAERQHALGKGYVISVFSLAGESVEEIAAVAELPNEQIRTSTVGEIRAAGFDVVPEGRPGHAQVTFPDVTNKTLDGFRAAFGEVRDNPEYQGGGDG
jgi:hypothetical protein